MRPGEVTTELALYTVAKEADARKDQLSARETQMLEHLETELREQANTAIYRAFREYGPEPSTDNVVPLETYTKRDAFHDQRDRSGYWSGESSVARFSSGDSTDTITERTRRWVGVVRLARQEWRDEVSVPEGCSMLERIIVDAYDETISHDGGQTWGDERRAAGLETVIFLHITGDDAEAQQQLISGITPDPLSGGMFIIERLDDGDTAFPDPDDFTDFLILPEDAGTQLRRFRSPWDRVGSLYGTLEALENYP